MRKYCESRIPARQGKQENATVGHSQAVPIGGKMLYYALLFLLVAVIAGVLGFGVVAFAAAGIAKILFFLFLVMFIVTLISHLSRRHSSGI